MTTVYSLEDRSTESLEREFKDIRDFLTEANVKDRDMPLNLALNNDRATLGDVVKEYQRRADEISDELTARYCVMLSTKKESWLDVIKSFF